MAPIEIKSVWIFFDMLNITYWNIGIFRFSIFYVNKCCKFSKCFWCLWPFMKYKLSEWNSGETDENVQKSSSKAGSPRILKCNCLNMPIVFCDKSTASTETNERLPILVMNVLEDLQCFLFTDRLTPFLPRNFSSPASWHITWLITHPACTVQCMSKYHQSWARDNSVATMWPS